jgi:hypothetical protein
MKVTERLRLCAMVATISVVGAGAARAEKEVTKFKANGAMATHNSNSGTTAYDLAVNRNEATGTNTTTFFSFVTQTCTADFSVCSGIQGSGPIPNGDFKANGGTASLDTNLATNSGFQVFNYIQDNVNGTFTQTPGVGGIVTINWKKIPRRSTSFKGTAKTVSGGFTNKSVGEQDSDSADTTGILLGVPLPTVSTSFIGTNKSVQVTITRS